MAGYRIWNMKELLQIFDTNLYSELFLEYNDGGWTKKLLGKDTVIVEKNCRLSCSLMGGKVNGKETGTEGQ